MCNQDTGKVLPPEMNKGPTTLTQAEQKWNLLQADTFFYQSLQLSEGSLRAHLGLTILVSACKDRGLNCIYSSRAYVNFSMPFKSDRTVSTVQKVSLHHEKKPLPFSTGQKRATNGAVSCSFMGCSEVSVDQPVRWTTGPMAGKSYCHGTSSQQLAGSGQNRNDLPVWNSSLLPI